VTFSPGAQLSMPNDLGLAPNGMADLFHLDPTTGVWGRVGMGTVDASGTRIATPPGTVTVAGLYAFATTILTTTTVSGSVVDPLGQPIQGVMVRVPGANTVTMSDGSYVLAPIATTDAAGMPRDVVIEAHGGRDRMPVMTTSNVTLSPGTNQVGDLSLAAEWVSIFLVQMINQGEVQPGRRVRVSGNTGLQRAVGVTDASGQVSFVNQSANGYTGLLTTRLLDADSVDLTQAAIFVGAGTHSTSLQVFSQMQGSWTPRSGGGPTATYVVDREGTGPVANAAVVQGDVPQQGYVGLTPDSGAISGTYGDVGQATASIATSAGGVAVVSAFTMVDINSARIELPLLRATEPTGAFDSHGLVCGTLQSAGSGTHQVRATRTISIDDWYDEVFFDLDVEGDVPIKVDPAVTGGLAFRIGVPLPSGNLVGLELTAGSNGPALDRFGFVAGLQPVAGGEIDRDLMLEYVPDTQFRISDALTNLSSTIAPATLTFDLALGLASGEFVDVARGIGGNMSASGTNLDLTLPALSGALAGGTYYVALHGTSITGGKVVSQQTFTPLDGSTSPYVRFLDVPDIDSPAPGATVSATGFTVQFTIPISTLYTLIELRAVGSSDERVWSAVLPASIDSFTFRELPPESPQPITPGLTWELKVTAARIETGPLSTVPDAYTRVTENWVGLSAAEQQVNAYSSTAITVTTN